MYKNMELRKLPTGSLNRVCETLEPNGDWKKVMSLIPKDPKADKFQPKYNIEHIRAIEEHAKSMRKPCAEVLFDEWGTSGQKRPTLTVLQNIILQAGIYRAADEIALMLEEPLPLRPDAGPAAKIDTSNISYILNETKNQKGRQATESTAQMKSSSIPNFSNFPKMIKSIGVRTTASMRSSTDSKGTQEHSEYYAEGNSASANIPNFNMLMTNSTKDVYPQAYPAPPFRLDTVILENKTLIQFSYDELRDITSDFSNVFIYGPRGPTGKIGSGGFGDVYAGLHPKNGLLAIKKFRDLSFISDNPNLVAQTFNAEVKCMAQLRHENIVPIIGYSIQKGITTFPSLCIVCQYIEGGSLEQNLAAKRLTEKQRIDVMVGTAKGLRYIHNRDVIDKIVEEDAETSFLHYMHGDVKSANILLTREYQPKLCDFGLSKQLKTTVVTPCVMGTTPYMSPERLQGTNTQKADIYSFGIVLLEMLTGLQSLVKKGKGIVNLQDYIAEATKQGDVAEVYDPVVDKWIKADVVHALAKKCLLHDYGDRPTIDQVCEELDRISLEFNEQAE